ncbi:MAG TPA: hypothetical protein VMG09_01040, partial [Bacteroidota bacterium]|nr:hypothetical protein [Bacteroidota bacterium]
DQDIDRQIGLLNSALEYSPGNAILLYSLGRARYIKSDYRGCVDVLQPIAARKWEYPPLYLLLAEAQDMLAEYESEKATLQQILPMDDVSPEAHALMGTLYRREGNIVAATAEDNAFVHAMTRQGVAMRTIFQTLSDMNINEGFWEEGVLFYRRTLSTPAEAINAHLAHADTLIARGDTLHAIKDLVRALAIDSLNRHATISLAQAAETAQEPRLALHYYRQYLKLDSASTHADYARSRIALLHP